MRLLWKLLRHHISPAQSVGFCIANLLGMTVVLIGIQFYCDAMPLVSGGLAGNEYMTVSKKISTLGSLLGDDNVFTAKETEDIEKQPFIKSVGAFTSSQFKVAAGISIEGSGIHVSTEMFFESVPDEFIDTPLKEWGYNPGDDIIPIIIPRNYLNLYNFGFASSRNTPRISEGLASVIRLDIFIRGNGKSDRFHGRIVGFSDRLNTILVPEEFIRPANEKYATGSDKRPSRLIVELGNTADENAAKYFREKGYTIEEGKLDNGRTAWFLRLLTGIVTAVGLFICLLSFYILILSISLLLQKNSVRLKNLLLIGYSPASIALPYQTLAVALNAIVLIAATCLLCVARHCYLGTLQSIAPNTPLGGVGTTIFIGVAIFVAVSAIDIITVRRKIDLLNRK